MSAVESGPPETARIALATEARSANSPAASRVETGAASAAGTLLFSLDALLEGNRGARIAASDLIEGGACRVLLAERRKRLAEPQQRIRRLGGGLGFGRAREERLRGIRIALALEQRLAEPIVRVGYQPIARVFFEERAEAVLGERIVLVQNIPVGEVVFVPGGRARRHHGLNAVAGRASRSRRQRSARGPDCGGLLRRAEGRGRSFPGRLTGQTRKGGGRSRPATARRPAARA